MIKEFKSFIARGNVIDLAVGIIVGGAFGKIVTSLVDNIIMPIVGIFIGGIDFSSLSIKVGEASIAYGAFIQSTIDFLIIAFCIFVMVKFINKFMPKKEVSKVSVKAEDVIVLEEIRDLLKKQNNNLKK